MCTLDWAKGERESVTPYLFFHLCFALLPFSLSTSLLLLILVVMRSTSFPTRTTFLPPRSTRFTRHHSVPPHVGKEEDEVSTEFTVLPLNDNNILNGHENDAKVPFLKPSTTGSDFDVGPRSDLDIKGNMEPEPAKRIVFRLLRFHVHDWLTIFTLVIIDGVLNIIKPFYRYVGESTISSYMFPLKKNTIPFQAVPAIALFLPIAIFVLYFLYKRDIVDLHHAILGLFFSVFITAVITDAVKDLLGLPRPDFFWRCFPDGNPNYDKVTLEVICHGDRLVIKEGHKSFPSGHTSWSFSGLGFLSLYIAGKVQMFDRQGHVGKTALVLLPLLGALLVGLSRVDDYWHHWQDVFTGAFLGFIMAILCYRQFFPGIHLETSIGPYCHAHMNETAPPFIGFLYGRRRGSPASNIQLGVEVESARRTNI